MPGFILDSSTDTVFLASSTGKWQTFDDAARIGANLFPLIESFLGSERDEISYIAVGRGPGSYTGTRAAVAAATGFALSVDLPLVLFPSPILFLPSGDSAALLEIKGSKNVYALLFQEGGDFIEKTATREELEPNLSSYALANPPLILPELCIPRIAAYVEKKKFTATCNKGSLVYLQQV